MAGAHFDMTGNNANLLAALNQSRAAFAQLEGSAQTAGMSIDQALGSAKNVAIQLASVAGLATGGVSLLQKIVGTRSDFQNTEAMFKVFLRDSEKASAFMDEIQKYAFNNVFDFGDLTQQAAQLMAYGTAQEDVIDRLDRLSNVAAGANVPLGELVNTYNKAKATDTLDSNMMNSLAAKGIRVREILADIRTQETGQKVTEKELEGITLRFSDLEKVLAHVTDEGGRYYGMMEEKMKTLGDSVGLLQDRVMGMFNEMGKKIQEPLREAIYGAADIVENWEEVVKILGGVAAAYGTVKAAMAFEKAWNNAENLYAIQCEQQMTEGLVETIKKYEKEVLQAQIAELQAAQSKGTITATEQEQLAQKERELALIESRAELDAAVSKGKMTQATADSIQAMREEIAVKEQVLNTERARLEQEIASYDQRTATLNAEKSNAEDLVNRYKNIASSADEQTESLTILTATGKAQEYQEKANTVATELNTIERQKAAAQTRLNTVNQGLNTLATQKDTIATNANSAAKRVASAVSMQLSNSFKALTASMMTNPLGWIAGAIAGLAALVVWLKKTHDAHDYAGQAAERLNSAHESATASAAREQRQLDELVSEMKTAKEGSEEYEQAKQQLIAQFSKYDDNLRTELVDVNNLDVAYKKLSESITHNANVRAYQSYTQESQNTIDTAVEDVWKEIKKSLDKEAGRGNISEQERADALAQMRQLLNGNEQDLAKAFSNRNGAWQNLIKSAGESNADLASTLQKLGNGYDISKAVEKYVKVVGAEKDNLQSAKEMFGIAAEDLVDKEEQQKQELEDLVKGKSYEELLKTVQEQEKALSEARKKYRDTGDAGAEQDVQRYQQNIKKINDAITKMTGHSYTDQTKMAEEHHKNQIALMNEQERLEISKQKDARARRKAEYDQQIKELEQEEKEYKRTHQGRGSGTFEQKVANAKLKYDIDITNLDKQWAEWKAGKEKEKMHLELDIQLDQAKNELANAITVDDRIAAQNKVRQLEDQKAITANDEAKEAELLAKLGGDRAKLLQYQKADKDADLATILGIDQETVNQLADIEKNYADLLALQQKQTTIARTQEDFSAELDRLQSYYDEVERIEQEYQEKRIELQQNGGSQSQLSQLDEVRKQQLDAAGKKLGEDDNSDLTERFTAFASDITGLAFEEIQEVYRKFLEDLEKDIASVDSEINALRKYDTTEDMETRVGQINQMTKSGVNENGEELNDEQINLLLAERVVLEQTLADIKANQGDKAGLLNQKELQLTTLKKGQVNAQQTYTASVQKAETKEQRSKRLLNKGLEASKEGLQAVKDATNAVADAFGGTLSKKGEKALDTISDIVDFGMQSINSIQYVANNANTLMAATAEGAAGAIQTVEKASVILTIISLTVQAIMAIVKIASKFTAAAQMQEQIDEYKEKVEDLKKQQERLEKAYKREVGSEYYKGMSKAAQGYNAVIAENNTAIEKATRLYEYQRAKYGEDSDKTKKAKKQLDELRDNGEDYADSQKEIYDELAESLLGTNVSSFAESLADTLVDAWQEGTTDMTEVWDTMLDDMKRDMMKKALSIALTDMFKGTFENIGKLAQNGQLNQAEIDQAIAEIDAKSAEAQAIAEQWRQAMSDRGLLDDANPEADSGGFQSMSQDTADELNARFTALQMEGAAVVTSTNAMLESVAILQANSDRSLLLVQDIDRFQQLAYEQAQEHIDIIRSIQESVSTIATHTARLRAIEQNTDRL